MNANRRKKCLFYMLYILSREKEKTTTSNLISELTYVFNPSGEDAEILAGRNGKIFSKR